MTSSRPRSESFGLAAGGFCSVEVVLGEAGLIAMRSSEGKDSPSLDMTELTAGFCNVVNMVRVDGDRTVVVKTFGDLARARIIAGGSLCFPVERAAADAAIAPALLHSSNNGSVNTFLGPQWSTLTEAAVTASLSDCDDDTTSPTQGRYDGLRSAAGANSSLICAVAAALAQLHALRVAEVELEATQEIGDAAPSSAAGAAPSPRRYARCKPRIWTSVDVLLAIAQRHPERLPSEWDIDAVAAACARERARLDAQQLTMVTGHGDFKPSNVMVVSEDVANDTARGGGAAAIDAQIIDFELAGPNYRGFDLCKFFRRDSGPLPHASLTLFASQYLAAGKTLLGGAEAEGKAVAALVQEAREMEPLTWLEAAVFFLAFMCSGEVIHDKERYEWAAALAQQRWSRFVGLRPEEADHRPAFGGGGAPVAPSST